MFFLSLSLLSASGQRVKVEPEVLSYPGQTVNLRCAFTDATGIQLTMVRNVFIHYPLPPACIQTPSASAHSAGWTLPEIIATNRRQYRAHTGILAPPTPPRTTYKLYIWRRIG